MSDETDQAILAQNKRINDALFTEAADKMDELRADRDQLRAHADREIDRVTAIETRCASAEAALIATRAQLEQEQARAEKAVRWSTTVGMQMEEDLAALRQQADGLRKERDGLAQRCETFDHRINVAARANDALRQRNAELEQALRQAWEDGIVVARAYGDNIIHCQGEQKERCWKRFLRDMEHQKAQRAALASAAPQQHGPDAP